jgi:hypothetical protein
MITGIGTPINHSKIPFPIVLLLNLQSRGERGSTDGVPAGKTLSFALNAELLRADVRAKKSRAAYQWPVFGIDVHGSAGGLGSPFCSNSIECRSGERTKAMLPSRGGRLMVMPIFINLSQVA